MFLFTFYNIVLLFLKEFRDSPVVVSVANNLDYGHVNPIANGEFTIFTPLSPPHYNNNIFLANQGILVYDMNTFFNYNLFKNIF